MDKFKLISDITKQILNSAELEAEFASNPKEVIESLLPDDYEGTEEEKLAMLEDVKNRVVMWTRNTGVASSVQ